KDRRKTENCFRLGRMQKMKWLSVIWAFALVVPVSAQTAPFTITSSSPLPNATVQVGYSQQLTSTGGVGTVTWSSSGGLPPGLSLGSSGAITCAPTQTGTFNFSVSATDARGNVASKSFSLTVQAPTLAITTGSPLPGGTLGAAYSATLNATGGSGVYSWSSSGTLPPGLSFSSTPPTGRISGTPTTAGVYQFSISVGDSQERTAVKQFTLTIQALPLTIASASSLPVGTVGVPYTFGFEGSGGVTPYMWSAPASVLPV